MIIWDTFCSMAQIECVFLIKLKRYHSQVFYLSCFMSGQKSYWFWYWNALTEVPVQQYLTTFENPIGSCCYFAKILHTKKHSYSCFPPIKSNELPSVLKRVHQDKIFVEATTIGLSNHQFFEECVHLAWSNYANTTTASSKRFYNGWASWCRVLDKPIVMRKRGPR